MIIHSTKLSTQDQVKSFYGGTTWIQHSGYVLRGATSGVTANSVTKTGGEDTHVLTLDETPNGLVRSFYNNSNAWSLGWWSNHGSNNHQCTMGEQTGYGTYGKAHNNIPNYKSVYIWERTA